MFNAAQVLRHRRLDALPLDHGHLHPHPGVLRHHVRQRPDLPVAHLAPHLLLWRDPGHRATQGGLVPRLIVGVSRNSSISNIIKHLSSDERKWQDQVKK